MKRIVTMFAGGGLGFIARITSAGLAAAAFYAMAAVVKQALYGDAPATTVAMVTFFSMLCACGSALIVKAYKPWRGMF